MDATRTRARDAALQRLRRLTRLLVAAAGVLGLVFAGIAAKAFPGRSTHSVARPAAKRRPAPTTLAAPRQTAPPLVSVASPAPQASPAPAASAPTPSPAPPAVVSGGS